MLGPMSVDCLSEGEDRAKVSFEQRFASPLADVLGTSPTNPETPFWLVKRRCVACLLFRVFPSVSEPLTACTRPVRIELIRLRSSGLQIHNDHPRVEPVHDLLLHELTQNLYQWLY
jgi:hypothetical protein